MLSRSVQGALEDWVLKVRWCVRQATALGGVDHGWLEQGQDDRREEERPARKGYGRELIERSLPYSFNAKTSYEINDRGVRCIIEMPLDKPSGP
jgi:hypothetical protein